MSRTCPCCARKITPEVWATLQLVGVQRFEGTDIPPLELRNCACGSTLCMEVAE